MNILNVNHSLEPKSGGTVERTLQMSRVLARHGEDVTILITDKGLNTETINDLKPAKVVALPCLNERFYIPKPPFTSIINELVAQADVIHLMAHWGILNALVYQAARRLKKPYVICPAGSFTSYGRSRHLKAMFDLVVGREMVRRADGFIAITEKEKEDFAKYGIEPARITVLPNAISLEDFANNQTQVFRSKYQLGSDKFILFLGRLNHIKGPDLLVKAFGQVRQSDYHLVFAGRDEGQLSILESEAERLGISRRIHFVGHLDRVEKSQALHACSLLAIPSRYEAMSIVALEAGAAGSPVLLTDQCGFDEIEKIGGGVVVKTSVEGLTEGLNRILAGDLKEMGRRLQSYCLENFGWDSTVKKYLDTYRGILNAG
jgi:glycosyltransferase involved in cell wall biosynthesis